MSDFEQYPNNNGYEVEPEPSKGFAIASLVLGILSCFLCCCGYFNIILCILAIVFGAISIKNNAGKGMGIAGLILAIVGLLITLGLIILGSTAAAQDLLEQMQQQGTYY